MTKPSKTASSRETSVLHVTPAGENHQVLTLKSGSRSYRKEPCGGCPWRKDNTGEFPPEAFLASARTAYDMSQHRFSCHESGSSRPATCAGFLLRGADHNLTVRMAYLQGEIQGDVSDGGHELHESYRDMAVANGVNPMDPIIQPCR